MRQLGVGNKLTPHTGRRGNGKPPRPR